MPFYKKRLRTLRRSFREDAGWLPDGEYRAWMDYLSHEAQADTLRHFAKSGRHSEIPASLRLRVEADESAKENV